MSDNTSVCKRKTHNILKLQPHRNMDGFCYIYIIRSCLVKIHKSIDRRDISPI